LLGEPADICCNFSGNLFQRFRPRAGSYVI
jgi:hypothetical protein